MNQSTDVVEAVERYERSPLNQLLVLLSLTGFAIAGPVLTIFGANPELFHFHNIDTPTRISVYALVVAFLPPVLLWIVTVSVGLLNKPVATALYYVIVCVLSALWLVQLGKWTLEITQLKILVPFAVVGAGLFVLAYLKWPFINAWLQMAAIAPVIFVGVFLTTSDTARSMRHVATDTSAVSSGSRLPSVVFIMFDEFPTMAMLNESGQFDETWFPNFAALSKEATWYRHYSVLADSTKYSVPSILTASAPKSSKPTMDNYPDNLFTLLAPTHHLTVFESATRLCGFPQCGSSPPGVSAEQAAAQIGRLFSKTVALWLRRVSLSKNIDNRLDDFQETITAQQSAPDKQPEESGNRLWNLLNPANQIGIAKAKPERLNAFVHTFTPGADATLYFLHLMMPHVPWRFYGDGKLYELPHAKVPDSAENDDGGEWLSQLSEYRFLIQAQYTDLLLGEIVSKLKALGMWNELLVIVTADHGRSFKFNTSARSINSQTFDTIAYAPLIIKKPFQTSGDVNDSNVMAYDLLPTIADLVGIDIPWKVLGVPVNHPDIAKRGDQKVFYAAVPGKFALFPTLGKEQYFDDADHFPHYSSRAIGSITESSNSLGLLNDRLDLNHFLGHSPDEFEVVQGGRAKVEELTNLKSPPPDRTPLGVIVGNLEFTPAGTRVLISINGRFVTGSPLVEFRNQQQAFIAMLPAGALTENNDIGIYLVEGEKLQALQVH